MAFSSGIVNQNVKVMKDFKTYLGTGERTVGCK